MGKADDGLRRLIQDHLPKPEWVWTPIETGSTSGGVPDAHFLHRESGASGWVESKKTDGWTVKFEPHQLMWHRLHYGPLRTFVAVRTRGQGSAEGRGDGLWLLSGAGVDAAAAGGLRAALEGGHVLGKWLGPPRSWDWRAVGRILTEYSTR